MKYVIKSLVVIGAIAFVLAPLPARADGFVTPWVGSAFGSSFDNGRGTFGVSAGGLGLIRTQIDGVTNSSFFRPASSTNMFGWDAGVGVMGYFNDHVGLRGEMRYLRATQDWDNTSFSLNGERLHFWRPSIGVVLR